MKKKYLIMIVLVFVLLVGCTSEKTASVNETMINQNEASTQEQNESTKENVAIQDENQSNTAEEEGITLFNHLDSEQIDSSRAMEIIRELSSEKYEGRQAGLEPNEMAEDYIAEIFTNIGLETPEGLVNYKQLYNQMAAYPVKPTEISILGTEVSYQYQKDFTERFLVGKTYYDVDVEAEMVFIEEANQLKGDVSGLDGKVLLVTRAILSQGLWDLLDELQSKDIYVEAVLIAVEAPEAGMRVARGAMAYDDSVFESEDPVLITCSEKMFDELVAYATDGEKISIKMDYEYQSVEVANIVGVIPGKNEVGADETLIIGAHLDHVGNNMNGTYNAGALDNASGVSVMIELARIIAASEQPEDTIVFVAFNGEEDGLIGSEYFVEHQPVPYKTSQTKMLNLDMVGSVNEVPLKICSLDTVGERVASKIIELAEVMEIDYKKDGFGSSDHVNFSNAGIPSVMFIHLDYDYYHTDLDTVDRAVSEARLADVIRLSLAFLDQEIYE